LCTIDVSGEHAIKYIRHIKLGTFYVEPDIIYYYVSNVLPIYVHLRMRIIDRIKMIILYFVIMPNCDCVVTFCEEIEINISIPTLC